MTAKIPGLQHTTFSVAPETVALLWELAPHGERGRLLRRAVNAYLQHELRRSWGPGYVLLDARLDEDALLELEERAAARKTTVSALVEQALQQYAVRAIVAAAKTSECGEQ